MIIVLVGPSGSGKTTVGRALATALHYPFLDADDLHDDDARAKMARGTPLDDADRAPWLARVHAQLVAATHLVVACSALRRAYRDTLRAGIEHIYFILLDAGAATLAHRVAHRRGHFMPASLVASQVATLERADDLITVDATRPLDDLVATLRSLPPLQASFDLGSLPSPHPRSVPRAEPHRITIELVADRRSGAAQPATAAPYSAATSRYSSNGAWLAAQLAMQANRRARDIVESEPAQRAPTRGLRERIGEWIGRLWAPAVARISHARHARMFHPDGLTFAGHVHPLPSKHAALARAFDGRVLVRCSGALWRGGFEHFDVLGFALRVRPGDGAALDERAQPGDQDLLFATIRSPLTMMLSPFFTDASDFVDQRYWAVSPFAHGGQRYELRVTPVDPPRVERKTPRATRLLAAVQAHRAIWQLEARETLTLRWHPIARIALDRRAIIDQAALAFDPFRTGLDIEPVGLVHAIRRAAYSASRVGRADGPRPRADS